MSLFNHHGETPSTSLTQSGFCFALVVALFTLVALGLERLMHLF